jgi:hypothetical protein
MALRYYCMTIIMIISLTGCLPIASVGGSAAISHASSGIVYKTFTAPTKRVRVATIHALARMNIKLISDKMIEDGKIRQVTAKSDKRSIEIELEQISSNSTRMRVTAKSSFFSYDSATAEEIIAQTKKSLS